MITGYCYGPVTVMEVKKYENSMKITVRSAQGRSSEVEYLNCIYWQIDSSAVGQNFLIVEEKTAEQLLEMGDNPCVRLLSQNAASIKNLIEQWRDEGMHFYVHHVENPTKEYLVVAGDLRV